MNRTSSSGFTLIELLITITILGILAGVVVIAVGGIGNRGHASVCESDRKTLTVAQEAYYARWRQYTTESQLVSLGLLREESPTVDTDTTGDVMSSEC